MPRPTTPMTARRWAAVASMMLTAALATNACGDDDRRVPCGSGSCNASTDRCSCAATAQCCPLTATCVLCADGGAGDAAAD